MIVVVVQERHTTKVELVAGWCVRHKLPNPTWEELVMSSRPKIKSEASSTFPPSTSIKLEVRSGQFELTIAKSSKYPFPNLKLSLIFSLGIGIKQVTR